MSDSDDSDSSFAGFRWEEQIDKFPPRTANTKVVQDWVQVFLEQRAFDEEEIEEFIKNVRLNGEDLHCLRKAKLRKILPKPLEMDGMHIGEYNIYHFEQMVETTFTDIMRARKQSGIIVPKIKVKNTQGDKDTGIATIDFYIILFLILVTSCLFWILL